MNYDEMSDREIDKKIIDIFFGSDDKDINRMFNSGKLNYCNNPYYAWPIIVENNIATLPTGKFTVWCAIHNPDIDKRNQIHANILEYDKNPLRAAMICFLKMKNAQ